MEPAEVFDGAQATGTSISAAHSSGNIPICMFGRPRKATKKWNAENIKFDLFMACSSLESGVGEVFINAAEETFFLP